MAELADSKKRIALNSMFLYCRKVVQIFIGFYASRLLLERLGEDGFGLYGLIGSVIVLFSSLRGIFTGSIMRYMNVAKSTGRADEVRKVFSMGMTIQLSLAVIFCILVECGGVFIIPNLNITPDSMSEAWGVFHLSLLAVVLIMLTVPYEALIMSNERFRAFAFLAVLESVLKLAVVLLLIFWPDNRVVWYAFLMVVVSLIVRGCYSVYCHRTFGREASFTFIRDRKMYKEMTVFAGWNFLGGTAFSIAHSGLNFVLNIFGGLPLNTARGIAMQVESNVDQFVSDLGASFNPRSIMVYARNEMEEFYSLIFWSSKVNFFVSSVLGATLVYVMYPVLHLWLGTVPQWTTGFTSLILIYTVLRSVHDPINTLFHASGKMKWYQITEFCTNMSIVPLAWLMLKMGASYYSAFVVLIVVEAVNFLLVILLARRQLGFEAGRYCRYVLSRIVFSSIMLLAGYLAARQFIPQDLNSVQTLIVTPCLGVGVGLVVFLSLFTSQERTKLLALVRLDSLLKRK